MQAPALTTAPPNVTTINSVVTATNTATANNAATTHSIACNPLDKIRGLTRFEIDVNEKVSLYFEDIIKRLKGPLLVVLRQSKKRYRPFAIRLLVLGVDESSAKPYVVVFCPPGVRDLVENYFRRDTPKRLCRPGKDGPASFDVIVEGNPIRPTTSQHLHPTSVKTGHPISGRRRHMNTSLKIDGVCGTRYATMGGYIIVVNKDNDLSMYGLTAGHSIVQDDLEAEVESERASEEPNAEQSLFPDIATLAISQTLGSAMSRTMHNTTFDPATNFQENIEWSGTAEVAPASFCAQACNRDWALLAGTADHPGSGTQDDQVFERYLLGDLTGTAPIDDGVEISLQPPFIGKLSRLPSFALLPYGHDFVRVHIFTTRKASGIPGTSGAWVSTDAIEPTAKDTDDGASRKVTVFGQVVADDALGDAYVVPLCDILDDVKHVFDAQEARLPKSSLEINTILRMMKNTTIASPGTTANELTSTGLLEKEVEPKPEAPDKMSCAQCGSEDHTKEMCVMGDVHSAGGSAPAVPPVVTASYTPSTYAASTKYSGDVVWFCSNCYDGPISGWQNVCVACLHEKCGACREEETC